MDGDLDLYLMTNFFYDPRGKTPPNARIVTRKNGRIFVTPEYEKFYGITSINGNIVNHDTVGQSDRLLTVSYTQLTLPTKA